MASINITADVAEAISKIVAFNQKLDQHNDRLKEVTVSTAQYNKNGILTRATVQGWADDVTRVTSNLRVKKGVLEATSTVYKDLTGQIEKARIAQEKLAAVKQARIEASKIKDATAAANDLNRAIQDISRSAQYFATYNIFSGLIAGAKEGFSAAKDLQIQISLIRTISQDAQQTFGKFASDIKETSDAKNLPIEDVSKAFFDAASNQIGKGGSIKGFVDDAADLAKTTGSKVAEAGNLLASAINAYNIPISEARNLSALFFKTIDEGRVVMGELANTFGRVAVQGKAVGVSITDVSASVAFLTKQGVLTSDALTFMTNLLSQIQKPSENLQAFFKSIGSKTGIEAVGTFGFVGLIQKLTAEVKAGNVSAIDFFKEIRAEKPFEAITNNFEDFKRITNEFKDVKQLAKTYQEAISIRLESPAEKLTKDFNELRNVFIVGLGQSLLNLAAQITTGFKDVSKFFGASGELSEGLNLVIRLARDGAIAFVTYRTTMALTTATTLAFKAATIEAGVASLTFSQKIGILGKSFAATLPGLVATVAAIAASEVLFRNDFIDKQVNSLGELEETVKRLRREKQNLLGDKVTEDPNKKFLADADPRFQGALQALSKAQIDADKQLDIIRKKNRQSADEIANLFKSYVDVLNRGVEDLHRKVTEARDLIKSSKRELVSFKESLDSIVLQTRLDYATDQQKVILFKNEIERLVGRAQDLVGTGDNTKIQEGLKLLDEAAKITKQRFDLQTKLSGISEVSTVPLQRDLNDLLTIRESLQQKIEASKTREIAITNKQIDGEKVRIRDIEDAFKKFNDFSAFTKEGAIDPRFKDKVTGRVKVDDVQKEFDKARDALLSFVGGDLTNRVGVENLIAQRRKDLIAEINATEKSEAIETAKTKTLLVKRELEDRLNALRKEFEEKAKLNEGLQKKLSDQFAPLDQLQAGVVDTVAKFKLDYKAALPKKLRDQIPNREEFFGDPKLLEKAFGDQSKLKDFIQKYKNAVQDLQKNAFNVNGVLIPKEEDIARVESTIKILLDKVKDAYKPVADRFQVTPGQLTLPGTDVSIDEYQKAIQNVLDELKGNYKDLKKNFTAQERAKSDTLLNLFPDLDEVAKKFGGVNVASDLTKDKLKANFSEISGSIEGATKALENFLKLMERVPGGTLPGKTQKINAEIGDDTVQYFANGGVVGFPGSPRGPDRYPIWAARGETIINAQSSAVFKDVLHYINSTRSPRYMAAGGVVGDNVSIGDINVVVNGSSSPTATAMSTAKQLERQLRRNNIRLSRRK